MLRRQKMYLAVLENNMEGFILSDYTNKIYNPVRNSI